MKRWWCAFPLTKGLQLLLFCSFVFKTRCSKNRKLWLFSQDWDMEDSDHSVRGMLGCWWKGQVCERRQHWKFFFSFGLQFWKLFKSRRFSFLCSSPELSVSSLVWVLLVVDKLLVVFLGLILLAVPETKRKRPEHSKGKKSLLKAFFVSSQF